MLLLGFNESIHFPWQRDVLRCRRCIELPSGGHESCLQGKQPFPLLPGGSHPPTTFPPTSIYSTYPPPPPPMGLTHRPLPLKTSSTVQPSAFKPNPQPLHFQPKCYKVWTNSFWTLSLYRLLPQLSYETIRCKKINEEFLLRNIIFLLPLLFLHL